MLRKGLLGVGLIMLAVGVIGWGRNAGTEALAIPGAILAVAVLIERYVYKPLRQDAPGAGWEQTGERFTDPGSGQLVIVYYNPRTGERRYVATPV